MNVKNHLSKNGMTSKKTDFSKLLTDFYFKLFFPAKLGE